MTGREERAKGEGEGRRRKKKGQQEGTEWKGCSGKGKHEKKGGEK